ncbi:hypothetical protein [Niabella beijingensis]|uniref:hypothetical protein n=1 Tax=Niabella beijingensis TaxID=2872700 RepID=UPI001CBDC6FD|nr:hypothetical protein [Niabella beijingensis]MBZ4191458.1 hypothetical protein [Niabella beijingensis]
MKKLVLIAAAFIVLQANAVNDNPINEKVKKTFEMVFAKAENVQWRTDNERNEASFSLGNTKVRAVIDNNGQLIRTIRYYGEDGLPAAIRYSLKKKYENKAIINVSELSENDGVVYYVTLKDEKHMITTVMNSTGEVIRSQKYKRGDI